MNATRVAYRTAWGAVAAFVLIGGTVASVALAAWFDTSIVRPLVGYYPLLSLTIRIGAMCLYLAVSWVLADGYLPQNRGETDR